jgi:large subunit ribosomal protein L13
MSHDDDYCGNVDHHMIKRKLLIRSVAPPSLFVNSVYFDRAWTAPRRILYYSRMPQKTYIHNPVQAIADRRWHHIDAKGKVLGRMATQAATLLRGKHKRTYTDFVDCGDFVVITNCAQIKLTGNKLTQKHYFSHSGYAGGAKVTPMSRQMERDPRKVVFLAVKRMIRNNRLRGKQLARLKIYTSDKHPHTALSAKKKDA